MRRARLAEVARSLGVSEVSLREWRAEYGAVHRDAVRRARFHQPSMIFPLHRRSRNDSMGNTLVPSTTSSRSPR